MVSQQPPGGEVVQQRAPVVESGVEVQVLDLVAVQQQAELLPDALLGGRSTVGEVHRGEAALDLLALPQSRQDLPGRDDGDGVCLAGRALAVGVEEADALYLVSPELDSHRLRRIDGEDVDDAATSADAARRVYPRLELVAHAAPAVQELLQPDLFGPPQGVARGEEGRVVDSSLGDRIRGGDHQRRAAVAGGQLREGGQTLVDSVRIGHQPLEGKRLRLREVQDERLVAAPQRELLMEAPRVLRTGRDDQHRSAQILPQGGQNEWRGVRQHLGPGEDPRSLQGLLQTPVLGRCLQQAAQGSQTHTPRSTALPALRAGAECDTVLGQPSGAPVGTTRSASLLPLILPSAAPNAKGRTGAYLFRPEEQTHLPPSRGPPTSPPRRALAWGD